MKASDNLFPKITLNEAATDGSDFSNPSADYRVLFLGEDGLLHLKDSAGAVTDVGASSFDPDEHMPWHVFIPVTISTPDATTGTWVTTTTSQASLVFPFYSPGTVADSGAAAVFQNNVATAQNDAVAWDVPLAAGTWDCHVWVRKHSAAAIITLEQDGSSMGTVDTYDAAGAAAKVSITGWTVSATGKKRMNFKAATKNGSSSNYFISMFGIEFRRTA